MSYRINSALSSMTAARHLSKAQRENEKALATLASGSRVANIGDDAAGFAISEGLRGQRAGLKQARNNAESAMALMQTAEGGLSEQNNILVRLRELAVYAASDTVGDDEREMLDREYQALTEEFDRIARTTTFGRKELLTGSGTEFEFHVGANQGPDNIIRFKLESDTTASEAGISGLSVTDQGDARDALETLDEGLRVVAQARSTFGSMQSRMQFTVDHLGAQEENIERARSVIADADIADSVTRLAKSNMLQDFGTSVLAQANMDYGRALKLIG